MAYLDASVPGRRGAAFLALLSLPLAIATQACIVLAIEGDTTLMFDGARLLALPEGRAEAFYWFLWLDPFGYYAINIPIIIYAWKALRHIDETVADFTSAAGIVYSLLGTFGAMIQAGSFEALYALFNSETATAVSQSAAAASWSATVGGSIRGLWLFEALCAGIWMLGLAKLLGAIGKKGLSITAGIMGVVWLVHWALASADMTAISNPMMGIVVMGGPLWAAWLGIILWPQPKHNDRG